MSHFLSKCSDCIWLYWTILSVYSLKIHTHFKICMLNPLFVKYRFQIPLFKCKICFISSATVLMTCADVPYTRSAGNVRRSSSVRPHVLAMVCSICVPSLCCKGVQVSPTQYTQQGHISARKDEKFVCPLLSWASGSRLEGAFAKKQSNWNCKMLKKYFKLKYFCTTNIAKKGITNGIVCTEVSWKLPSSAIGRSSS